MASLELAFLLPLLAINACWILGALSLRFAAVHELAAFLLEFFLFWCPSGDAAPAPAAPASPLPAPSPPPKQVAFWPGSLDDPAQQPPRPFAWERRLPYCAPGCCSLDDPAVLAELREVAKRYVPRPRPVKVAAVQRPRVVAPAAPPPVVEPFDPVAWKARLDAFSAAIHMPSGSLLPDPRLVLAVAVAPVPLPMPVQGAEIAQPTTAALLPPPPAAQRPKEAEISALFLLGPATATTTAAEKPQQLPPRSGPVTAPAKPPAAAPVQHFQMVATTTKPAEQSSTAPPPPPPISGPVTALLPPAVTPVQHPRPVKKAVATTTKPAPSSSTASPLPPPPSAPTNPLPPATNLPQHGRKVRATMEAAHELLGTVEATLATLGGDPDTALGRAWQACLKPGAGAASRDQLLFVDHGASCILGEVLDPKTDRLDERQFSRADLERMGLKGGAFVRVMSGYDAGARAMGTLEGGKGWSTRQLASVAAALREVATMV